MRRVRDERYLFFPEHLLLQFSVHELEAAATSLGRWSALTMSPNDNSTARVLHSVRKRVYCLMDYLDRLQKHPAETGVFSLENLETYLVPGGQYLVTWSGTWLALWNIGSVDINSPPLLAVTFVKDYRLQDERTRTCDHGMTVQATAHGESLRVLVFNHHAER
jgi:hypothetical protein